MRHRLPRRLGPALLAAFGLWCGAFSSGLAAEKVQIDFWFGESPQGYIDAMRRIVDQFNATNPRIQVNLVLKGHAPTEPLKVAIAGGVPPDVVYTDGFAIFELGLQGMLIPLNQLLPPASLQDFERNYLPGPRTEVTRDGTWYGLPWRMDTRGVYMNMDLLERAGFDPQRGPANLPELDAMAAKLTIRAADGSLAQLGFAPKGNNFGDELAWMWAFGGDFYDYQRQRPVFVGRPEHLAALDWIRSYAERYGAAASASQANFLAGKVALHVNSTTRLLMFPESNPNLRWWTSTIPTMPGVAPFSLGFTLGPAVPVGAKHPREAAEFIQYLAQPNLQVQWFEQTQSLPTRWEALRRLQPLLKDPRARILIDQLPVTRTAPPLYGQIRTIWTDNLEKMRQGQITPYQVLENTQRAAEPIYNQAFRASTR